MSTLNMEPFGHFVLADLKCPKANNIISPKTHPKKPKSAALRGGATKETLSFLKQKKFIAAPYVQKVETKIVNSSL